LPLPLQYRNARNGRLISDRKGASINADVLARTIAHIASDAKATDVVVLGIRDMTPIADFFVICTADNERQMRAIQRDIDEGLDKQGVQPRHVEGTAESGWILMDYGDVIAHVFSKEERAFYSLDKLWSAAQPVLVIQ
jgi:ribosome-associated protein